MDHSIGAPMLIKVPNRIVAVDAWMRSACYPRGSFYPLRHGLSTQARGITSTDFRPCAACQPCSQAGFCACTPQPVAIRPEPTFARLRYILGGDRPSQTTHLTLFTARIHGAVLEAQDTKGGISRVAPPGPQSWLHSLPPILSEMHRTPIPSCSKGSRGLSV